MLLDYLVNPRLLEHAPAHAERILLGFDHAEVGGAIAKKWAFPEEIRHAIAVHHQVPVLDPTPLVDCVMLAISDGLTLARKL